MIMDTLLQSLRVWMPDKRLSGNGNVCKWKVELVICM